MDGKAELELSPRAESMASSSTLVDSPLSERKVDWGMASMDSVASGDGSPADKMRLSKRSDTSLTTSTTSDGPHTGGRILFRQHKSSLATVTTSSDTDERITTIVTKHRPSPNPISLGDVPKSVPMDKKSCLENCACKCHTQNYRWPEKLQAKSGRLFYESTPRFTRRCSDSRCRAGKIRSKVTFVYPSSMVKKVVSLLMFSKGFKVRFQLKTQRLQPPLAPVIQSVLSGDLKGVKKSIETGAATPSDILSDGWTLTHTAAYWGHLEIVQYLLKMRADTTIGEVGAR